MTLEEQVRPHAQYWDCYNDEPLQYNHTGKLLKIINEYAIEFANWINNKVVNPNGTHHNLLGTTRATQLLPIFKKEKGL